MDKKPSTTADKAGGVKKTDQISVTSKDAGMRGRDNLRMVQNVLLIWLDANINEEKSADCRHTVAQLRRVINTIDTFTDGEECISFIKTKNNEKACMIISGSLGKHIVPRVHNMSQVDSIFIFCGNKKHHEQWVKEWPKIKGIFTEIVPICEALKQSTKECEQNAMPMSFVATSSDMSNKNLNQLDNSFMYTQIMKEILLTITFEESHMKEFLEHCREQFVENDDELNNINEVERKYRHKTPIWWYTYECFLYPMLNRALRLMDVDVIIKMGFFIGDLHRHIEQLHSQQVNDHHSGYIFTVYRGQGMSKEAFEQMQQTKGGLMSFNSFLSTSKDRDVSLTFARRAATNPDLVGALFVMTIDPSKSTAPFASIIDVSYFKGEDEVLFSMHTVFRIRNIKPMDGNHRLFQVDLTLTDDNDKDLRVLTDRIREETFPNSEGWHRLGELLRRMGESQKAQQVFETVLEQTSDESGKASVYIQLGVAKYNHGDYEEAIAFYEKSLQIYQKTRPPNHSDLAWPYTNIGSAYYSMGDYSKALSFYEKALAIQQQSLPTNHPDLASSYMGLGGVYYSMGDYPKALSFYEKALAIQQQLLPTNHPDLAGSYMNIGVVYYSKGNYPKALSFYEKALAIQQESLPPNHPNLGASYNSIGSAYHSMGDYAKALSFYEKGLAIRQQSLPPNHPDLGVLYNNIGLSYENTGDYSKAQSFFERAVDIGQHSLPSNHPYLKQYRENFDRVKKYV